MIDSNLRRLVRNSIECFLCKLPSSSSLTFKNRCWASLLAFNIFARLHFLRFRHNLFFFIVDNVVVFYQRLKFNAFLDKNVNWVYARDFKACGSTTQCLTAIGVFFAYQIFSIKFFFLAMSCTRIQVKVSVTWERRSPGDAINKRRRGGINVRKALLYIIVFGWKATTFMSYIFVCIKYGRQQSQWLCISE